MYQTFYGFTRLPFAKDISPTDLFAAPDQKELAGRLTFLLVIDEAHLLPPPAFEQFRLLLSDQMDSHSLASLLLIGQPGLRDTLRLATNQAFYQRLTIRYHLQPLDLQHTLAYIRHHIQTAGFQGTLFTDDALSRIFDYTKGVPRQINLVCTTALLAGMLDEKTILDETTVRKAIADIDRH